LVLYFNFIHQPFAVCVCHGAAAKVGVHPLLLRQKHSRSETVFFCHSGGQQTGTSGARVWIAEGGGGGGVSIL
jgi:hypothetical protein